MTLRPPTMLRANFDLPRERLARLGAEALSDAELLAMVLGHGTHAGEAAQQLLRDAGGLASLMRCTLHELRGHKGMSDARAARLVAGYELSRRALLATPALPRPLPGPEAALAQLLPRLVGLQEERVYALLLDGRRRPIEAVEVARGDPCRVQLAAAAVFRPALLRRASAIVLAHNHPSGDPTPSPSDVKTTRALVAAGDLLGVALEAHFVVAGPHWRRVEPR